MKLQKLKGTSPSYLLVIPSQLVRAKGWKKGDNIDVEIDKNGNLVLKKNE